MMQGISEFHLPYAMSLCYNVRIPTLRIYPRHLQCVGVGGVGVGGGGGGGDGGVGGCSCSGYLLLM